MPNISKPIAPSKKGGNGEPKDILRILIAQIHVAKKDLKLGEDEYRALLAGVTGRESCADLGIADLNKVLNVMRLRGWKPKVKAGRRDPSENDPRLKKIFKLWYLLRDAGKIASNARLNNFIEHQTGIQKMEWLKEEKDFQKVIEGLKGICKREGVK